MSKRWIDDDVLAVTSAAPVVLTPTKILRAGSTSSNYVRFYNYGPNPVYYNFSRNQNPPLPPNPSTNVGIPVPLGGTIDVDGFDDLQNLQFITASTQTATLYVLYGTL